jgi:hypothetical protein
MGRSKKKKWNGKEKTWVERQRIRRC